MIAACQSASRRSAQLRVIAMYEQLELPIDRFATWQATPDAAPSDMVAEPQPALPEPVEEGEDEESDPPIPFGSWLLAQQQHRGLIGLLAKAAKADIGFPKMGAPDDVRSRLTLAGADGDMFEAIDDAEAAWLAEL